MSTKKETQLEVDVNTRYLFAHENEIEAMAAASKYAHQYFRATFVNDNGFIA